MLYELESYIHLSVSLLIQSATDLFSVCLLCTRHREKQCGWYQRWKGPRPYLLWMRGMSEELQVSSLNCCEGKRNQDQTIPKKKVHIKAIKKINDEGKIVDLKKKKCMPQTSLPQHCVESQTLSQDGSLSFLTSFGRQGSPGSWLRDGGLTLERLLGVLSESTPGELKIEVKLWGVLQMEQHFWASCWARWARAFYNCMTSHCMLATPEQVWPQPFSSLQGGLTA